MTILNSRKKQTTKITSSLTIEERPMFMHKIGGLPTLHFLPWIVEDGEPEPYALYAEDEHKNSIRIVSTKLMYFLEVKEQIFTIALGAFPEEFDGKTFEEILAVARSKARGK